MKNCPSFPGYSITEEGEVFSHRRRFGLGKGRGGGVIIDPNYSHKLNPYKAHAGYSYVAISTNGKQRSIPVHVLLLDAFICKRPPGSQVRHLDGDPTNNALSNLAYGSPQDNSNDKTYLIRKTVLKRILTALKKEFGDIWNDVV